MGDILSPQYWMDILRSGMYTFLFDPEYLYLLKSKPDSELYKGFAEVIEEPISHFEYHKFYFYIMWYNALKKVTYKNNIKLLEIASGGTDIIPQLMDKIYNSESLYISANMNKQLTRELYKNTKNLRISIDVIEEDAKYLKKHFQSNYFDLVAFQHSANDIIQAILCDREGIDTINTDWMEVLPQMIKILQREMDENTLEEHATPLFIDLLSICLDVLAPDGFMVFNHHMLKLDLDWGYPYKLCYNMIPMVREWISNSDLKVEEVQFEGFDKQWWMFLKKL